MQDLINYALSHGWGVKFRDLGRRNGEYARGLITINDRRRTEHVQRMTLAHEIGHAIHDHRWTDDPAVWARQERDADIAAAHILITAEHYAYAERLVGPDSRAIAAELGVRELYVILWRETHQPPPDEGRHLRAV